MCLTACPGITAPTLARLLFGCRRLRRLKAELWFVFAFCHCIFAPVSLLNCVGMCVCMRSVAPCRYLRDGRFDKQPPAIQEQLRRRWTVLTAQMRRRGATAALTSEGQEAEGEAHAGNGVSPMLDEDVDERSKNPYHNIRSVAAAVRCLQALLPADDPVLAAVVAHSRGRV